MTTKGGKPSGGEAATGVRKSEGGENIASEWEEVTSWE